MSSQAIMISADNTENKFLAAVAVCGRMVLPIVGLLVAIFAVYLYADTPVVIADPYFEGMAAGILPSTWLNWGLVLVPATFFVVHLTNRRFGPNYAFAQIVTAWSIVAGLVAFQHFKPEYTLSAMPVLPVRTAATLAGSLLLAQFTGALVFESTRGVRWWHAPLFGSFLASAVFVLLFFPIAFFGMGQPWLVQMLILFGFYTGIALGLLLPYWFFRSLLPPLPGFGGY